MCAEGNFQGVTRKKKHLQLYKQIDESDHWRLVLHVYFFLRNWRVGYQKDLKHPNYIGILQPKDPLPKPNPNLNIEEQEQQQNMGGLGQNP